MFGGKNKSCEFVRNNGLALKVKMLSQFIDTSHTIMICEKQWLSFESQDVVTVYKYKSQNHNM